MLEFYFLNNVINRTTSLKKTDLVSYWRMACFDQKHRVSISTPGTTKLLNCDPKNNLDMTRNGSF